MALRLSGGKIHKVKYFGHRREGVKMNPGFGNVSCWQILLQKSVEGYPRG
jgi:hypothetical protein